MKDWKTGDSLQYGFIEFEEEKSCEMAYMKMENVGAILIYVMFCLFVCLYSGITAFLSYSCCCVLWTAPRFQALCRICVDI